MIVYVFVTKGRGPNVKSYVQISSSSTTGYKMVP